MSDKTDGKFTVNNPVAFAGQISVSAYCHNCNTAYTIKDEQTRGFPLSISDKPTCGICKQEMSEEIINDINQKLSGH